MVLSITTFLVLRACLKNTPLGDMVVFGDKTLADLSGGFLKKWGDRLKGQLTEKASKAIRALDGPVGILPGGNELEVAQRRALGTALRAFHAALEEPWEGFSLAERQWHYVLGCVANEPEDNKSTAEALYARCEAHLKAALGENTLPDLAQEAHADMESILSAKVHAGLLTWLTLELTTKRPVDPSTPQWVLDRQPDDSAVLASCPQIARDWLLDPEGFGYRGAKSGDWLKRLFRRPPVQRPWVRMTLLQAWSRCFVERLQSTPRAFQAHLMECLDDLKAAHPQQAQAIEVAKENLDAVLASTLRIEAQLAQLLGVTTARLSEIVEQGDQAQGLLTALIQGNAQQSKAWQHVSQQLGEIQDLLMEQHAPPIDRSSYAPTDAQGADVSLRQLVYRQRWLPTLLSREAEMGSLLEFLNSDAPYSIHILVGEAGTGKSRLALELMLQAQGAGWRAGFLLSGTKLEADALLHQWRPTGSTLLIVDYASEQGVGLAKALALMSVNEDQFQGRLRVLLVDRPESLHTHLNEANQSRQIAPDSNKEKVRQRLHWRNKTPGIPAYQESVHALFLKALDKEQWETFLRAVFVRAGQNDHQLPDAWKLDVAKATADGRPLMLIVLGLHYLRQNARAEAREDMDELLDGVIDSEVQKHWTRVLQDRARPTGKSALELLPHLLRVIGFVTLCRGISLTLHQAMLRRSFGVKTEDDRVIFSAMVQILGTHEREDGHRFLRPLEPDLLGERFLLREDHMTAFGSDWIDQQKPAFHLYDLLPLALETNINGVLVTLWLIHRDYRGYFTPIMCKIVSLLRDDVGILDDNGKYLSIEEINHPIPAIWLMASESILKAWTNHVSSDLLIAMLQWAGRSMVASYVSWVGGVALAEVAAIKGLAKGFKRCEVEVLEPLLKKFENTFSWIDTCMQPILGYSINAIVHYGGWQDWESLERWGIRLIEIAKKNPAHSGLQLMVAEGSFNAINAYGGASNWQALERWGGALNWVENKCPADPDAQWAIAHGAFNAICHYIEAKDWFAFERWGKRLVNISDRHADHQTIQHTLSQAAVNAMTGYGKAKMWRDMSRWQKRLLILADRYPDYLEIQVEIAKGASNAMLLYARVNNWGMMEKWGMRLMMKIRYEPFDEDIYTFKLIGFSTAVDEYGRIKDWNSQDKWISVMQKALNPAMALAKQSSSVVKILARLCSIQRRDKRKPLQELIDFMSEKCITRLQEIAGQYQREKSINLVSAYDLMSETDQAEVRLALAENGISIEWLRQS